MSQPSAAFSVARITRPGSRLHPRTRPYVKKPVHFFRGIPACQLSKVSPSNVNIAPPLPDARQFRNPGPMRYITYTLLGLSATILIYWSGTHYYVESLAISSPSGPSNPARPDIYGWQEEVLPWTGGQNGGTSKDLGWRGRMALRAAWMAMAWGVGDGISLPWHHDVPLPEEILQLLPDAMSRDERFVDRRYERAVQHVDEAIVQARKRCIKFPPTLGGDRSGGPPVVWGDGLDHDASGRDLLLLKAGVLERLGSMTALGQAGELYKQVLVASRSDGSAGQEATVMRLAHKVGEMYARQGEGQSGLEWWTWGLKRVGVRIPQLPHPITTRSWFGKSTTTQPDPTPISTALIPQLPPPVHRVTISLLASISTFYAFTDSLPLASAVQRTALSLLPGTHDIPAPLKEDAPLILHDTWLQHRSATIALNHSEVLHALGDLSAQKVCNSAQERASNVWSAIYPLPKLYAAEGVPWHSAALALQRDAAALTAESSYTRGLLLELSMNYNPEEVIGLYETAMKINARRRGRWDEESMDDEWQRYYKRYSRLTELFGRKDMIDEIEDDTV